jgi:glucan phosphoethanolaminetransferase (alkaline phosphatase superfamily)
MRNAALVLGIIGGLIGMMVGFFSYGYTEVIDRFGEIEGVAEQVDRVGLIRMVSFLAPLLAIAGGAMARIRALWAGILMLLSAGAMYYAFHFNVFTMFPIGFTLLGGILAIAAGKPDEPKAHF